MYAKRLIMASVVLMINGFAIATEDACASGACTDVEYCLTDFCSNYTPAQIDQFCKALNPDPFGDCCFQKDRCLDPHEGGECTKGDLLCRYRSPCP